MDWLLMFLMSEVIDHPVSRWDEMFLPGELEKNVAALRYRDERGIEKALVNGSNLYYAGRNQRIIPERASPGWPWALIAGTFLGLPALLLSWWIRKGRGTDRGRKAWTLFGVHSAVVGLILGVLGSVLFFMSRFTDHAVTYGNENLFVANPLTLVALPLGLAAAIGGKARSYRLLQLLWFLLAGVAVVYLLLKPFSFFGQTNAAALSAILPVLFGLGAASWLTWKRV
jgi:hypothetical protein